MFAFTGACGDGGEQDEQATQTATATEEFVAEAEALCADARAEFADLGTRLQSQPGDPDPLAEALIRPGAEIYARLAEGLRAAAERVPQPSSVSVYLDYFEVVDALLDGRLRVDPEAEGAVALRQQLEARYQRVADEQAEAALAAGLSGCGFDVQQTITGQ